MKRHPALEPLSRDHHRALVIARELGRASSENAAAVARRFVEFLKGHELAHFALEEAVLLPALPEQAPGPGLAQRVHDDHAFLRQAMERLGSSEADVEFLHTVGRRLREHVQMEERELFPYLEESLSAVELESVGARIEAFPGRLR
jgi:hemerythrin-like domain-containing protein